MGTTSKRRYKIGLNESYDRLFDDLRMHSPVLNEHTRTHSIEYSGSFDDKTYIVRMLLEWKGDKAGQWRRETSLLDSKLKILESHEDKLKEKFTLYQTTQVNLGYRIPQEMLPEDQLIDLELQATRDVLTEEIGLLEEALSKIDSRKKEIDTGNILKYGPVGSGRLHGGILVKIDGQKVSKNKKGELVIDEPSSPYNKMLIHRYRDMVLRWKKAVSALTYEKTQLKRHLFKSDHLHQFDNEWMATRDKLIEMNNWSDLFTFQIDEKMSKNRRPSMPDPKVFNKQPDKKGIEKIKK